MKADRDERATIFLAGDVMTGRGIDQIQARAGDPGLQEPYVRDARDYVALAERAHGQVPAPVAPGYVWGDGLEVLAHRRPAAAVVNLETSVTRSGSFWPGKAVHYRMHPHNVRCLAAAHIDVWTLANNHVLDFGRAGLLETLSVLRAAGIGHAGAGADLAQAERPARVPLGDGTALLVYACGSLSGGIPPEWAAGPSLPGIVLLRELSAANAEALAGRIREGRRPGELAVASIHWGSNWGCAVPDEQVTFAHRLVDGGVDIVHGHSSHHPRPIEIYRGRLILYGCGDLVTDYEGIGGHEQWRGDLGLMYFATVSLEDGALMGLEMVPVQMRRMRLSHASPEDAAWLAETLSRIGRPFGTRVTRRADGTLALVEDRSGSDRTAGSPAPRR